MKRIFVKKRYKWEKKLEKIGFSFHSVGGCYWNEGVCYEFSNSEIDHIEEITKELHEISLTAVDYVIEKNFFSKMCISEKYADIIKASWKNKDVSIYGRFDFSYDAKSDPKLLEYNADTPTSLIESSIVQWLWLEDLFYYYDQFNSIHEKLLEVFKSIREYVAKDKTFYFSCINDYEEDYVTVEYLRDVAIQAGFLTKHIFIEDIGYSEETQSFYDTELNIIEYIFKLYPWEWLSKDEFGEKLRYGMINFFEPPWKIILSNKGILPILWEMYPNHKNLLPSYFSSSKLKNKYVKKPIFSREGANIKIYDGSNCFESIDAGYGSEGYIYQELKQPPCFDGNYAVIGSWIINNLPAGIGIREDDTPITQNTSRFVPHYFKP